MGNGCIKGSSSATVWAGEDWGYIIPEGGAAAKEGQTSSTTVRTTKYELRVRISKKELEELLRKADKSGSNVRQTKGDQILIKKLIDKCDGFEIHHQRHWKPALQSIPAIN